MGKKRIITKGEIGEAQAGAVAEPSLKSKKSQSKEGKVYIASSYNNTLMTLTDEKGNVLVSFSAGQMGFKGTKKSTPFAASKVADALSLNAQNRGIERVRVVVKGVGSGRDSALRSIGAKGLEILSITDATPIPHNGPRPPKVRRV
ncbi:MAG: 30S ribosomal protein S11 [bacterium]|nr:30S ribosomal protein S11 [bacterium]